MNTTNTTTDQIQGYAVLYKGKYWGPLNHEHRVDNIRDARVFTKKEGCDFIMSVHGATLRPIPSVTREEIITKWNGLTATEKMGMGDRMITHESDLHAWNKNFDDLSDAKKEMVIKNMEKYNPSFTMTKDSGLPVFG